MPHTYISNQAMLCLARFMQACRIESAASQEAATMLCSKAGIGALHMKGSLILKDKDRLSRAKLAGNTSTDL